MTVPCFDTDLTAFIVYKSRCSNANFPSRAIPKLFHFLSGISFPFDFLPGISVFLG